MSVAKGGVPAVKRAADRAGENGHGACCHLDLRRARRVSAGPDGPQVQMQVQ